MGSKNPLDRLLSFFSHKDKNKKTNLLIMIGAFGILLIILANSFAPDKPEVNITSESEISAGGKQADTGRDISEIGILEKTIGQRLEKFLSQVAGVGKVSATVNLASTTEYEYAIDTSTNNKTTEERDQKGGNRTVTEVNEDGQLVLIRQGEGNRETPVIKKEIKPEVQGVMIVAEGADNPEIQAKLIEAVEVFLNVPPHRVVVLPKESR